VALGAAEAVGVEETSAIAAAPAVPPDGTESAEQSLRWRDPFDWQKC